MRGLHQHRPRPVRGWLRTTLTIVWVGILSTWMFYHSAAIYVIAMGIGWDLGAGANALTGASALLRTLQPLWLALFLPALATCLAWYLFSLRHRIEHRPGVDRRTLAELYGTLCVALCGCLLNHRIMPIPPMVTSASERVSDVLLAFLSDRTATWSSDPWIEEMAVNGALLVLVVLARAWTLLPRLGASRRVFFGLAAGLLIAGLALSDVRILVRLVQANSWDLHEVAGNDLERGVVLGDPRYAVDAREFLSTYLTTHDDRGRSLQLDLIRNNQIEHVSWDAPGDPELRGRQICEVCRIPGVQAWTMSGLSFYLAAYEPLDRQPTHVIEVPRRGTTARVYRPVDTSGFESMNLWDSIAAVAPSDWVVLKIDGLVKMDRVRDLLRILAEEGVRRVDLAVIPHGYERYSELVPRLVFRATGREVEFVPRESPYRLKSIPPPPRVREPPMCEPFRVWDYISARGRHLPTGENHPELKIETTSKMNYAEFIGVLSAALFSQPDTIVLTTTSDHARQ